jgi:multisubunit Na+/H+ antiporter MnhB subunit
VAAYVLVGFVGLGFLTMFGALSDWPGLAVYSLVVITLVLGVLAVVTARLERRRG